MKPRQVLINLTNATFLSVPYPDRGQFDAMIRDRGANHDRNWKILELRGQGHTLAGVAQRFSISPERVRQIEFVLLKKFRAFFVSKSMTSMPDWPKIGQHADENH